MEGGLSPIQCSMKLQWKFSENDWNVKIFSYSVYTLYRLPARGRRNWYEGVQAKNRPQGPQASFIYILYIHTHTVLHTLTRVNTCIAYNRVRMSVINDWFLRNIIIFKKGFSNKNIESNRSQPTILSCVFHL